MSAITRQATRSVLVALSLLLVGCQDTLLDRSLLFATHTTAGVEVALNPAETVAGPVKIIIGYNRVEGVINPVYHSEGVTGPALVTTTERKPDGTTVTTKTPVNGAITPVNRYREPEAYSVLAKFSGHAEANGTATANGKLSVAQWFATGQAAILLAGQPGIAGAISGSSEVAKAAAAQQLTTPSQIRSSVVSTHIYDAVKGLCEDENDKTACMHKMKLDTFASSVPADYLDYTIASDGKLVQQKLTRKTTEFPEIATYRLSMETSILTINLGLKDDVRVYQPLSGNASTVGASKAALQAEAARLQTALTDLESTQKQAQESMSEAAKYYVSRVFAK